MAPLSPPKVQLLSVPDCPLVKKVQAMVSKCLVQTQLNVDVEVIVGDYNSPTLLVDGFDVTGRPAAPEGQMSCRLDLPSEEQILAALHGMAALRCEDAHEELVQATAFRSLLRTGQHVAVDDLATSTNLDNSTLTRCADRMRQVGHITLTSNGLIDGAAGLSLAPTGHEISINGRRFWTWCALDVLGIFGALRASGSAKSSDPSCGESIEFQFIDGVPQDMNFTVFMANLCNVTSVCRDWCPSINFFVSKSSAEEWARKNAASGSVISVENVVHVAREVWSRLIIT